MGGEESTPRRGARSIVVSPGYGEAMSQWTVEQRRHLAHALGLGPMSARTVYESLGADFFAAPAPGFLNLGLWDSRPGSSGRAPRAAERLVATLASHLPLGGEVLDVANGLGAQDPVIAEVALPRLLVALNLTESQLRAGREHLRVAGALPVAGDATRLPFADARFDGVISVEAAFHFPSRAAFLAEARRVLRPGGTLTFSDVSVERRPREPLAVLAGLTSLRFWGLHSASLLPAARIAVLLRDAGFVDVRVERCGHRTIDPFIEFLRERLDEPGDMPPSQRLAARTMGRQWRLLRRRGVIDYLLVRARKR